MADLNSLLKILLLLSISASEATICESPFTEVGKACIHVNSEAKMNWSEARNYCKNVHNKYYDPDLAVVDDCDDLNPIRQYLLLNHGVGNYWLGGYDMAQEGYWHWVNDRPMAMAIPFWVINSPDGGAQENCLSMLYPSGYFDDADCSLENYPMCSVSS